MVDEIVASDRMDQRLGDLLDIVGRTSDAMIAVGADMEIVGWNDAATKQFGHSRDDVLGRPCSDVLRWRDRCGNPICEGCSAGGPKACEDVIETREVIGRTADDKALWLSATTIVPPAELLDRCRLVHLIREVWLPPELENLLFERLHGLSLDSDDEPAELDLLTPREREVLGLLTEGLDGAAIGERLFLSKPTVRNHIQHILAKLGVHSRAEAVAFALRRH